MSATLTSILAIAAAAAAAGGTAMSFSAASKEKKAQKEAQDKVKSKMSEARKKLETNYMDVLSINKEPFERQREALLSAGAQALEAGIESERGGAATAGRLLAAQNEAQGQVRDAQSDRLFDLEAAQAEEDSRLRDIGVQLDLGEVAGAQDAAAASADRAAQLTREGVQGAVNTVGAVAAAGALYGKTPSARQVIKINKSGNVNNKINDFKGDVVITDQTGTAAVQAVEGVGLLGDDNHVAAVAAADASSNFRPAQNNLTLDGITVDITPIQGGNISKNDLDAFLLMQPKKWLKAFNMKQKIFNANYTDIN
jgi:hypothetical protein